MVLWAPRYLQTPYSLLYSYTDYTRPHARFPFPFRLDVALHPPVKSPAILLEVNQSVVDGEAFTVSVLDFAQFCYQDSLFAAVHQRNCAKNSQSAHLLIRTFLYQFFLGLEEVLFLTVSLFSLSRL